MMHPSWEKFRIMVEEELGESIPEELFKRIVLSAATELSLTGDELLRGDRAEEIGTAMGLALFREKLS